MVNPDIEKIAEEVMDEYEQSDRVKSRFLTFYENTVENNLGGKDLHGLINAIELAEGEELNGS